jgi:hypothetical protein
LIDTTKGFIEFIDDETFIIVDEDFDTIYGKYKLLNMSSISLEGIGEIFDIQITTESLKFKFKNEGSILTVNANKAKAITENARNTLLCRNWEIDDRQFEIDNGEPLFSEFDNKWFKEKYGLVPNRNEIIFSKYGTYLSLAYRENTLLAVKTANWEWNEIKGYNYFNYWWWDYLDEDNYCSIDQLTKDVLKITNSWEWSTAYTKYVLYPVEK